MGLSLITPPVEDAVTLADVKLFCGIEDNSFDALLTALRDAAVAQVEDITGRALAPQGWRLTLDGFSDEIELTKGPVSAVTSVGYYDAAGAAQVVDPAVYSLDLIGTPAWVVRNEGESWPTDVLDAVNAVSVDFTAGFAEIPAQLVTAVCSIVAAWFENRTSGDVPSGAMRLLNPFRQIVL